MLGYLLHVESFIVGGLIAKEIPYPDPIGSRNQRGSQRLQSTRPNRSNNSRFFTSNPTQGNSSMRGFDLTAYSKYPDQTCILVNTENFAQFSGSMSKYSEESADTLAKKTDDDCFR